MKLLLALDTCFLKGLDDRENLETGHLSIEVAHLLIERLKDKSVELLVDTGGEILTEYRNHVTGTLLGQTVVQCALTVGSFDYRSDKLSAKTLRKLAKDSFDLDDLVFLAICHKVDGLYVTAEEKHLNADRRALVLDSCGVRIASIFDLAEYLRAL